VARLASIPHGATILAQGTASTSAYFNGLSWPHITVATLRKAA
jgi:hypothetical protein